MKTALRALVGALLVGSGVLTAQTFTFAPFEFDSPDDSVLAPISLSLSLSESHGIVSFGISNDSVGGDDWVTSGIPTITNIYFEDSDGLLFSPVFVGGTGGLVAYDPAETGGNLPGGNNIGFDSAFYFAAAPPPSKTGIDPGETATFAAVAPSLEAVATALANEDLRIGLHVQEIGPTGELSASYISRIPEPSTALLSLCSIATLLFVRRR